MVTNKELYIIGASGHGKVVAEIALLSGYSKVKFFDDKDLKEFMGFPVVSPVKNISADDQQDLFVAIGDSSIRKNLMDKYNNYSFTTLVHPFSAVSDSVEISEGCVFMAGAIVNVHSKIGKGSIVNTSSSIDHDCTIGEFCHIAVGAHIAGGCNIGSNCWIGAGATISNNITICDDVVVGAGATVVNDILEPGTYVGVPVNKTK